MLCRVRAALPQTFVFSDGRRRDGTFNFDFRTFLMRGRSSPRCCCGCRWGCCEVALSGRMRLFGRRAIGCLERSNQGIRVLRSTHVRHIPATQHIHELPRPRDCSLVVFIVFAVAVTITNKPAAVEPTHANDVAQSAAS